MINQQSGIMIRNKVYYVILSGLFLLQTLTLPVSVPELVLCVAEDHVQLEIKRLSADCAHDTPETAIFTALQHNYHSDDCNDIPLFQHTQHVISQKQRTTLIPFSGTLFFTNNKDTQPAVSLLDLNQHSPSFSPLRVVRSVVLLI